MGDQPWMRVMGLRPWPVPLLYCSPRAILLKPRFTEGPQFL